MLELIGIKKDYLAGENTVHALKGIDLKFRKSEFVSILGPSGCGKTTMLNIIGGLDGYTSGDLVIGGKSTKSFKARDWDTYRNHSIGFVFQSYNLIPHQTVLQNVELALTLSGVSKSERRQRAKEALKQVGLENQLRKKPCEMSGGQMQRVAIARALVNNPDIILADEPTGALDTETSIQVMEILKSISKDRLVIMVTHNPELAEKYSTRIIKMLDGVITNDSLPLSEEEIAAEKELEKSASEGKKKLKKPSMSFATSFSLSLKNLFTKKGRTMLTSFAGSIGIIGIALVLAISQGFSTYINDVQEETLSSYPLTIQKTNVDLSTLMQTFMGTANSESNHPDDAVYEKPAVYNIVDAFTNVETSENDLRSFKKYIEEEYSKTDSESGLHEAINGIQYGYDLDLLIYTKNVDGTIIRSDSEALLQDLIKEFMNMDMTAMNKMYESVGLTNDSPMMTMMQGGISTQAWQQLLPGDEGEPVNDLLKKQYDVVYGDWPANYNEIVLVLDENNEIDDVTLYALGLQPKENMDELVSAAVNQEKLTEKEAKSWSYEELCEMDFSTVLNSDCYSYDEKSGTYTDLRESDAGVKYIYDNGLPLKITGIIKPNENSTATMLSGAIGYTYGLTEYVIEHTNDSKPIKAQLDDPSTDIFTGLPFRESTGELTDEEKAAEFKAYANSLSDKEKAEIYVKMKSIPDESELQKMTEDSMKGMTRADMEETMITALSEQMGMSESEISSYTESMSDEELTESFTAMMQEQVKAQYAASVREQMTAMSPQEILGGFDAEMDTLPTEKCAVYYDELLEFSDSTYEDNLKKLGCLDLEDPSTINLYASSFENKDIIEDAISAYNENADELSEIKYTDYVGIMMSSVTTIIDTIAYVLIAFVAISLIVSSIMIAVITLISVQERTKEIGILRAIGASKKNVSSMFNAETLIIGFSAGMLGVIVTYLLCIPINSIVHSLTGIMNLNAFLPAGAAVILVLISMGLNLLSGLIPSRSAAKKDPVVALRTE
ncbi:MAG: ABC transporter ATP-binding protein/permease [Oscillospiraceae bacterium]|nr:ABC transporter ATP-binding protein/permease [Oscillospiraceae bacterium]